MNPQMMFTVYLLVLNMKEELLFTFKICRPNKWRNGNGERKTYPILLSAEKPRIFLSRNDKSCAHQTKCLSFQSKPDVVATVDEYFVAAFLNCPTKPNIHYLFASLEIANWFTPFLFSSPRNQNTHHLRFFK